MIIIVNFMNESQDNRLIVETNFRKKTKKLTLGKRPVVNHLRRLVETLTHIVSIYVWLVY